MNVPDPKEKNNPRCYHINTGVSPVTALANQEGKIAVKIPTPKDDFGDAVKKTLDQLQQNKYSSKIKIEKYSNLQAAKNKNPKSIISIEIDPVNNIIKTEDCGSNIIIEVEDVVDVDIYNRFDQYYRDKIALKGDQLIFKKNRSKSLELALGRDEFGWFGAERNQVSNEESLGGNQNHIYVVQNELLTSAKKSKRHLDFRGSCRKESTSLNSCAGIPYQSQSELDYSPQDLHTQRATCQICTQNIAGHSEHLVIFHICEHRFHYSCLQAIHDRMKHTYEQNHKYMLCPKCNQVRK